MKYLPVSLASIVLLPMLAAAQPTAPSPLTIAEAVSMAQANHPTADAARAGALAASEEVGVAKTAYLPRIDLLWQANVATRNNIYAQLLPQFVVPPVSGPVLPDRSLGGVRASAAGALLSWEVLDFGRRAAVADQARAEAVVADAERRLTDLQLSSIAADVYLRALASEAVLVAARANVQRLEAFAVSVRTLVQSQLRAGSDLSRADAELATAANRVVEAERDAELARLTLAEAIGVPSTAVVLAASRVSAPRAVLPQPGGESAAHPGLLASDARLEAARSRDLALERSYRPRVELQAALSGRSVSELIDGTAAGSGFALDVPNWAVGVTMSFSALDLFRVQARRRVESARQQQAEADRVRTEQALQSDAARARAVITAADRIVANSPRLLQAARDANTQAAARYEAGLGTVVEVAEAQRLLADAEAQSAVAVISAWRARLGEAIAAGDITVLIRQLDAALLSVTP